MLLLWVCLILSECKVKLANSFDKYQEFCFHISHPYSDSYRLLCRIHRAQLFTPICTAACLVLTQECSLCVFTQPSRYSVIGLHRTVQLRPCILYQFISICNYSLIIIHEGLFIIFMWSTTSWNRFHECVWQILWRLNLAHPDTFTNLICTFRYCLRSPNSKPDRIKIRFCLLKGDYTWTVIHTLFKGSLLNM